MPLLVLRTTFPPKKGEPRHYNRLDKMRKFLRLLRFFACASSFMPSLVLELNLRTFEPMNLVFRFWIYRLLQTANGKLYPLRCYMNCASHLHYTLHITHYSLLFMCAAPPLLTPKSSFLTVSPVTGHRLLATSRL